MVKPNYAFDKRQKELAKKRKKEEKRLQKERSGENKNHDAQPSSANEDTALTNGDT